MTLDNRPALDVMLEDLGLDMRGLRTAARDTFVGLVQAGAEASGGGDDYLVRNLTGIDPENKLVAVGDTPTLGGTMMFCKRDLQSARGDLLRMIYDLKDDLKEPPKPRCTTPASGAGSTCSASRRGIETDPRASRRHTAGGIFCQRRNRAQPPVWLHGSAYGLQVGDQP